MESSPLLSAVEYVGVIAFAVSAAVLAAHKGMDIVGVVVLGVIVSLAGGSLRDVVLGVLPVFWVTDPTFAMVGALAVTIGGIDALVFTGGIGENSAWLRRQVCNGLT